MCACPSVLKRREKRKGNLPFFFPKKMRDHRCLCCKTVQTTNAYANHLLYSEMNKLSCNSKPIHNDTAAEQLTAVTRGGFFLYYQNRQPRRHLHSARRQFAPTSPQILFFPPFSSENVTVVRRSVYYFISPQLITAMSKGQGGNFHGGGMIK